MNSKTIVINGSEVMNANIILAQTGSAMEATVKSLQLETLKERMRNSVAHFCYQKVNSKNGKTVVREAWGTLNSSLMRDKITYPFTSSPKVQVYFDVERGAFRSFRKCNFLTLLG